MKKVLVLGGSVFIGRAIAKKFIGRGDDVYVLNRGNHECPNGATHLNADRSDMKQMKEVLKNLNFDVVIDGSAYQPEQTKIIVEILKGRTKHFIHLSSAAVYVDSEILPYKEDSQRGTSKSWGDYSTNKYLCEELLFKECKNQFPITIIRPFYVYGPNNNLDRESYIFSRLLNNKPIVIPSKGIPMIQFGHIDDLCEAISMIAENERCFGQAYNVSGLEYTTLKGWVEVCAKILNIEPKIYLVDTLSTGHKARDWFPFRDINMIGSCEKIRNDIGFTPKYNLYDGLKNTIEATGISNFTDRMKCSKVEEELIENYEL